ncbi:transmembrane protein 59 [Parasteatoda tepidariorum]|nr:transmembrane protein 59 [Parasteatoda tepidariorum]
MLYFHLFPLLIFSILCFHIVSCAVLEKLFNGASSCETGCDTFFDNSPGLQKSCAEGCRLYTVIGLAKDIQDVNKTTILCIAACSEAFVNESANNACNYGCCAYPPPVETEEVQTLHLLTPLMYVKSAYNSMTRHVKQFISTSWTVYVQEDSGKMIVLQTSPKVVESLEYSVSNDEDSNSKDYQSNWQEAKVDWMDCISHQSGIPRWILVVILFGFVFALLWLCCATAVTAPHHRISSKKKELGFLIVCETSKELKAPLIPLNETDEEAPPLPPKVSLI